MKGINSADRRELRAWLQAKYSSRCAYCNRRTKGPDGTIDHYVPQALGGTSERENLRWACQPCNQAKADLPPHEWELRAPDPVDDAESPYQRRVRLLQRIARKSRSGLCPVLLPEVVPQPLTDCPGSFPGHRVA